jgi:hypothetical protein
MRYIITTNNTEVWNKINFWNKEGKLKIVDKGDLIETLRIKIDTLRESLEAVRKTGISMRLLSSYLYSETGLSRRDITKLLSAQDSFFKELGIR